MKRVCIVLLAITLGSSTVRAGEPVLAPKPAQEICNDCRLTVPPPQARSTGGPRLPEGDEMPRPLPLPQDAIPLAPRKMNPEIESLVEKHLGDLAPEEQQIWIDELNGLPAEVARELLLARDRAGGGEAFEPLEQFDTFEPPVQSEPPRPATVPMKQAKSFEQSIEVLREAESIILNNIANAETVGFKRIAPLTAGAANGVTGLTRRRIEVQGPLRETGRSFDWALEGPGLFQVEREGVVGLTRWGLFHLNEDGLLATTIDGQAWLLHPKIQVPAEAGEVRIDEDGTVHCRMQAGGPTISVGRVELAFVTDLSQLETRAAGLWTVPEGIVPMRVGPAGDAGFAKVRSGFLEGSNVELADELDALERVRHQIAALQGDRSDQLVISPDTAVER